MINNKFTGEGGSSRLHKVEPNLVTSQILYNKRKTTKQEKAKKQPQNKVHPKRQSEKQEGQKENRQTDKDRGEDKNLNTQGGINN